MNSSERSALEVLVGLGEATSGEWHAAMNNLKGKEIPLKTFQNWRAALVSRDLATADNGRYQPTDPGRAVFNGTPNRAD